ncbi:hypothetical protein HYPSUDRAFT_529308 [Hypholoma sublateritium FD-334 SS-4]|uniref:Uncharacterized protein n=1 Tax=Hypholoma sublateritium (strain FD-334 SS-4) TaxID=945553 RepID=A0A0D2P6X8_HYPSF|nr:hypothetical protein HYPSUDRAFT_529308 [Hypholoma sublateritium FD-334 SS-4]
MQGTPYAPDVRERIEWRIGRGYKAAGTQKARRREKRKTNAWARRGRGMDRRPRGRCKGDHPATTTAPFDDLYMIICRGYGHWMARPRRIRNTQCGWCRRAVGCVLSWLRNGGVFGARYRWARDVASSGYPAHGRVTSPTLPKARSTQRPRLGSSTALSAHGIYLTASYSLTRTEPACEEK